MDRLAICRICLNANVSHLTPDTQLKEVYKKLTSMWFQNVLKPSLVCHICHAQLRNAHKLTMKCLRAEDIMTQMLNQLVASEDRIQQESIQIDGTEFTQLMCTAVEHIDIEPLPDVNERIRFTFEEDLVDVKTEVKNEEDILDPVDDTHQALNRSDVDSALTRFDSEDNVPLNNVRQETETVTDTQNITTVEKIEPIGWEEGTFVANKSTLERQTNKTKVNKYKENSNAVKSAVMPNHEVTTSMCSVETETSTTREGATSKDKHNKHDGVVKSENKYQWSDSFENQYNEEYTAETMMIDNESNLSDKYRDNKKNNNLITSNMTVSNTTVIESYDQNITSSYPCNQQCDMNDFKQCKTSQNNNTKCKRSTKDNHLVRHSENETQLICDAYGRNYSCESEINRHVNTHTRERPYSCKICDKTFTLVNSLKLHERMHTGERPYSCKICYNAFTKISHLINHERIHTGVRPYICKICDKRFTQIGNLRSHERIHTGERPYSCKMCDDTFTQLSHLKSHERMHTGKRPYSCKICDKRFTQIGNLQSHERIHTGERPYSCKMCDDTFTQVSHLKNHERMHTGKRPYICKICDKRFTQIGNLQSHERIHTGERPYSCKMCDDTFTQVSHLKNHERMHTGKRPYICKICDKRFTQIGNLQSHERIHTGERPYGCKICDDTFTQVSHLKSHERTHAGEILYNCKICDKRFTRKSNIKNHECIPTSDRP